jgi:hypothetical protein
VLHYLLKHLGKDGKELSKLKNKRLYFVFSFSLLFLTSCLPVYECNDYVRDGSSSKWDSNPDYEDGPTVHTYYFSDSVSALTKIKSKSGIPYLHFRWGEGDRRIYTTTFFYLPIFPDFLFNSPKDKDDDSHASMDIYSENDSIIFNFRKTKFIANNVKEIYPYATSEHFTFVDSAGKSRYFNSTTIGFDSLEIIKENGYIHNYIDKRNFENIKYYDSQGLRVDFNVFSDTIKTLTVIFDSAEVKGKKVYIEPLHLKQRTYRRYDYSIFK